MHPTSTSRKVNLPGVLRIGNLTSLQEIHFATHSRTPGRNGSSPPQRHPSEGSAARSDSPILIAPITSTATIRPSPTRETTGCALLTFAKWRKRYDAEARLSPVFVISHLLFALYVVHHQKPNVHGEVYFQRAMLSAKRLIPTGSAYLGYDDTVRATMAAKAALRSGGVRAEANPDAGVAVADAVGQSPRQRFGRTAQTGGRADADRTAGSTAARADRPPRGSRSGPRQVHCRGACCWTSRSCAKDYMTAPPARRCRAPQVLLLREITRPADGKPTGEVLKASDPAGRRLTGTANVDRSGRCEMEW